MSERHSSSLVDLTCYSDDNNDDTDADSGAVARSGISSKRTYWFGTINNYTDVEIQQIKNILSVYCIVGFETAPTTGTKHLHFVLKLGRNHQKSYKWMKKLLPRSNLNYFVQAEYDRKVQYAKKKGDYYESGSEGPAQRATQKTENAAAQRQRFAEYQLAAREGRRGDIPADFYTRYYNFYEDQRRDGALERAALTANEDIQQHQLKSWQEELLLLLEERPDPSTIHWIYDPNGQMGKSWFCEWYCSKYSDASLVLPGKAADMANALDPGKRVYLFDIPRCSGEKVAWGFIEQLKNGYIFNSKYRSNTIHMVKPHVVVFSNALPPATSDTTGFSIDRMIIRQISTPDTNLYLS